MSTATRADPVLLPSSLPDGPPDRPALAEVLAAGLVAMVTFAVYVRTRHFAFIRYDDTFYISHDHHVLAGLTWAGLRYAATRIVLANWHPFTTVAEMAVVQAFGPGPAAFHVVNATLHAVNVFLLYAFLRAATGLGWRAVVVAAAWGWHPLRVESVAWVSELKDGLCGFFWLATLLAFWSYRRRPTAAGYAAVAAGVAAALLAKSMAVSLPAVLVLLDDWPLRQVVAAGDGRSGGRQPPSLGRRVLEYLPLFVLSAVFIGITLRTQSAGRATGSLTRFPVEARVTNSLAGYLAYVQKSLLPTRLALFHPHPAVLGRPVPVVRWVGGAVLLAGVTAWAVRVRRSRPYAFVGWLWFVGTLVPVIGLVQVGEQSWADRYSYLPSIGLTIAVVWTVAESIQRRPAWRPAGAAVAGLVAVALLACTVVQIGYWRDDATLFAHADRVVPDNYVARTNLALDESDAGHMAEAERLARSAITVLPAGVDAHYALAHILEQDGRLKPAFAEYEAAIVLGRGNPWLRNDFGGLLVKQHRDADAVPQFQRAIKLDPELLESRQSLGVLLMRQGKYAQAMDQFRAALDIEPGLAPAHADLGDALRLSGDSSAAIEQYRDALAAGDTTSDTKVQLAWLTGIDARATPADLAPLVPLAKQACDQTGNRDAFPLYAYSLVLARVNRYDDAIAAAGQALDRARATHEAALAANIERRLAAYRQGLPAAAATQPSTDPTTGPSAVRAATSPGQ